MESPDYSTFSFQPHEITPSLIRNLALDDEVVLNALCKAIGIDLRVDRRADKSPFAITGPLYVATPKASPPFAGTKKDVALYVHGYACAWAEARAKERSAIDQQIHTLQKRREELS